MLHNIKCPYCQESVEHTKIKVSAPSGDSYNLLNNTEFLCPHCDAILGSGIGDSGMSPESIAADIESTVSNPRFGHLPTHRTSSSSATDRPSTGKVERTSRIDWPVMRNQHELEKIAQLKLKRAPIYPQQGKQIGVILKHFGIIDEQMFQIVRSIQKRPAYAKKPLGETLVDIGIINNEELTRILLIQAGKAMVDLHSLDIPADIFDVVPLEIAREKHAVPLGIYHKTLYLAVSTPFTFADRSFFTVMTGMKIEFVFAPMNEIIERGFKFEVQRLT
jgi:Type II secretion system (T2SS), protein E, N-terminal domain